MITFAYPWSTPTTTIDLRDPDFNDRREIGTNVKVRTMMDGSLRTRRTTPANQHIILRFSNLTRTKVMELRDFLLLSQGNKIRYYDIDQVPWVGFITTDPNEVITNSVGLGGVEPRKEFNQVEIDFEGVPLG